MSHQNSFQRAAVFFFLVCLIPFVFPFIRGLSPFWGDLTYLQHPWRLFDSQELMTGRLPLWNPYLYFGMPQAAAMQDGLYYPASILFDFFRFPAALFLFHVLHYWLGCFLAYLWLRSLGFSHSAGLCAGLLFGFSGIMISREPFLNNLPILALIPALCLFASSPLTLSLSIACAFLSGHPEFTIGGVATAGLILWLAKTPNNNIATFLKFAFSCLVALALSGVLFFPAVQLFLHSVRAAGIPRVEAWQFRFNLSDLKLWISPLLNGLQNFNPGVDWWKCVYLGFGGTAVVLLGLGTLPLKKSATLGGWILFIVALTLAGSNPVSSWLWRHFPFIKFIRFPGNLTYMILIPMALIAAFGFEKLSKFERFPNWIFILAIATELSIYVWRAFPLAPFSFFSYKGPLVESLQNNLGRDRYLLSPLALEETAGKGILDWKGRLYGLTNSPFHLNAGGNFGQPLVPADNYALMDFLYSAHDAKNPAQILPWADIRYLLTPLKLPPTPGLIYRKKILWEIYEADRAKNLSRAYFLNSKDGLAFPAGPTAPASSLTLAPLRFSDVGRPDELIVAGNGKPGWVFVSQARYPGWKIFLQTSTNIRQIQSLPALAAFQKVSVPENWKLLFFVYDSWLEDIGILVSVISLAALAVLAAAKSRRLEIEAPTP